MSDDRITKESVEQEFPEWEAFQGVDRRWHARIRGAETPVMVHDDDLLGLREEIVRKISKMEEDAWRDRQRGGWHVTRNGQEGAALSSSGR